MRVRQAPFRSAGYKIVNKWIEVPEQHVVVSEQIVEYRKLWRRVPSLDPANRQKVINRIGTIAEATVPLKVERLVEFSFDEIRAADIHLLVCSHSALLQNCRR